MTVVQCPRCQFRVNCWFMSVDGILEPAKVSEDKYCPFFEPDHYLPLEGPTE